jgi:pimeloyl-ACP methyl ester carboxylesterase
MVRTWPQDIIDNAAYRNTKLTMPVLAIGAASSLGDFVAVNAWEYASDVTGVVVPDSGHWIYEERPSELSQMFLDFL